VYSRLSYHMSFFSWVADEPGSLVTETGRDSMGGPITNDLNPVQKDRKRYVCMMLEASTTQFETMYTFLERGGQVLIDSTFGFNVSFAFVTRLESYLC
jgi:hypothetical protein